VGGGPQLFSFLAVGLIMVHSGGGLQRAESVGRHRRAASVCGFELLVAAGLIAFLAATNRWMSWQAGYRLLLAHDETDYRAIAVAAPRFPTTKLQVQHAQRFVPHYLIGLLGHLFDLNVVYMVVAILLAVFTSVVLAAVLARAGVPKPVFAVCMAVFVLNTYSLRYYWLAPGELADLLLDAAVLLTIFGLLKRQFWLVVLGISIGTLARQTDIPVAVAAAVWLLADPRWREVRLSARLLRAAVVLAVSGGLYAALVAVSAPFSAQTTPSFSHFTLLADLEALPADAGQLGQHFLRCVNGLLSVAVLLVVGVILKRREHRSAPLPFAFWGCVLIAAAIILQPALFSAEYAAHNETRLAVMGLGALVCSLAYVLKDVRQLSPWVAVGLIAVLGVASFHHLYTVVGTANAHQTVGLQIAAAVMLGAILWAKRPAPQSLTKPR
jgi:hypothetical protein